jgi:hypothetical protein
MEIVASNALVAAPRAVQQSLNAKLPGAVAKALNAVLRTDATKATIEGVATTAAQQKLSMLLPDEARDAVAYALHEFANAREGCEVTVCNLDNPRPWRSFSVPKGYSLDDVISAYQQLEGSTAEVFAVWLDGRMVQDRSEAVTSSCMIAICTDAGNVDVWDAQHKAAVATGASSSSSDASVGTVDV